METGIRGTTPLGPRFGEFVWAIDKDLSDPLDHTDNEWMDLGLIRLDPGVRFSPRVCTWGGPTRVFWDRVRPPSPVRLRWHGNAIGIGDAVPARSGVAFGTPDPIWLRAWGASTFGDSGSPVISDDHRAVGLVVQGGFGVDRYTMQAGPVGITRLGPAIQRGERMLGIRLRLIPAEPY